MHHEVTQWTLACYLFFHGSGIATRFMECNANRSKTWYDVSALEALCGNQSHLPLCSGWFLYFTCPVPLGCLRPLEHRVNRIPVVNSAPHLHRAAPPAIWAALDQRCYGLLECSLSFVQFTKSLVGLMDNDGDHVNHLERLVWNGRRA